MLFTRIKNDGICTYVNVLIISLRFQWRDAFIHIVANWIVSNAKRRVGEDYIMTGK